MGISDVETYAKLGDITPQGFSIDYQRRLFNFGNRIAEIEPRTHTFFSYISKLRKKNTDDVSFKFLEQRHQWQRRNFDLVTPISGSDPNGSITSLVVDCGYDEYGRVAAGSQPQFFIDNQVIGMPMVNDATGNTEIVTMKITQVNVDTPNQATLTVTVLAVDGDTTASNWPAAMSCAEDVSGQVIGSAFAQGTGAPAGWRDELYDRDGHTQIFKTAIPLFTGSARATKYRGVSNEYLRVWKEKIKEHQADLNNAMLFGVGQAASGTTPGLTWGIVPYTEAYGNTYNLYYGASKYDDLMDYLEQFFAPETGNSFDKLVLTSRKILNWLNKLGDSGFLKNTIGSSQYDFSVDNIKGAFGHNITKVTTTFGNLHFIQEPMLRGWMEDYAVAVDLKNIAYRPLVGNGISRDTFIKTNVQENDVDGRKDMITTEAGLEVSLPETHAIFKFS